MCDHLRSRHLNILLAMIGLVVSAPFVLTQVNDEPNIIRPTPAFRLADDLTTVLLVNNDGVGRLGDGHVHGRYLSVRPEVGLLTSTARTFIQEGITTEYATQVLGTTLENGRLYAQYLKKSSRVLFENGHETTSLQPSPAVLTSWVGEGDTIHTHSRSKYIQSHNDLFNADAADWRAIEDSLDDISSGHIPVSVEFVGNTDFPKIQDSAQIQLSTTTKTENILDRKQAAVQGEVHSRNHGEGKLTANKVLPVGDLPTFTVKNHFEPSGYHANGQIPSNADIDAEEIRSAKEYYWQQQQSVQLKQSEHHPLNLQKERLLSTVTYYGFADFTTVVGDSVIVFSPNTRPPIHLMGHVTSIKGVATLQSTPVEDEKLISSMTTAANAPPHTVADQSNKQAMETTETIIEINEPQANSTYSLSSIETSPIHTPDLDLQSIENVVSQQSGELDSSMGKSMLSLPTDQEIFEIYASLTKAEAKKQQSIPSNTQPTRGGATTIFVDDDPFANFAEPSKILTSSSDTNLINEEKVTSELHLVKATEGNEKYSAITTDIDTNTELPNPIITQLILEPTQLSPLPHNSNVSTCEQQSSQIFLTQFPKLITILSTHVQEKSTLIETSYSSSYDIKETTKYYCIPPILQVSETTTSATKLTSTTGESNSVSEAVSEFKPEAEKESETDNISTMNVLERDIEEIDETTIETTSEESLIKIESSTEYSNVDEDYVTEIENEDYDNNDNDSENGQNEIDVIFKTLFTTYTYLTTFFEGASTAVSSHTEIVTNVITSIVGNSEQQKESISTKPESSSTTTATEMVALTPSKYVIQNEFDRLLHSSAYDLESNFDELSQATLQLDDAKYTKTFYTTYTYYTTIFADSASEITSRTEVFTNYVSELLSESSSTVTDVVIMSTSPNDVVAVSTASIAVSNNNNKAAKEVEEEKEEREKLRFVTDVRTSSSTGNHKQVIGQLLVSKDQTIEDQVSSESNTEEILPSETLLLQTSFTTFTFYTTMYEEDVTNVVSRLETVTNIVTETVQPTKVSQNQGQQEDVATLPITYFTTFTYWTKLAKDGEITTISREETISNVIEPTKQQQSIESYTNMTATKSTITETTTTLFNASKDYADAITTFYTTYTYYTTSYDNNNTVTDSRLETVTNIFRPTDFSISNVEQSQTEILPEISTSMLKVDASKSSLSNLILYDYKHIIDAESVSTLYFTTNIYASINQDGTTVELTSSTSHLHVDEEKKMHLATTNSLLSAVSADRSTIADGDATSLRQYKTGLVRLIEGTRIGNNTTTLYQSKVIGTIIDNRYAQIIESTSSFLFENQIEPSATSNLMDSIVMSVTESLLTLVEHDYSMMEHHGSTEINLDEEEKDITNDNDEDQVEIENSIDSDNNLINAQAKPPEKKRTFAPVIRPFASRNRPTNRFAPKQKTQSASSATIITRLDITPTITATPALKSVGRFSSSRRIPTSNVPNNFSTSSRRLFGRPIKPSSGGTFSQIPSSNIQGSSTISTLPRNRFASSLRTAQTSNPSRRLSSSYRGSSSTNNYRISALNRNKPTIAISPTSIAKGNTDVSTDALLEEEETDGDESNAEVYVNSDDDAKANENARRQQNPLLRFRRPLNRPNGFTLANRSNVISGTSTSPRRNSLSVRTKSTTVTPTTTTTSTTSTARARPRSFQRPTITNLPSATRSNNKLFPPRGLFQKKTQKLDETGSNLKENDDSEYDDDDEEMGTFTDIVEDGQDSDNGNNRRRRSQNNKKTLSRRRRQTADVLNRSRFRFRRPKTTTSEEPPQGVENHEVTEGPPLNPRLKQNARYGSRFQTHSQPSTGNSSSQSSSSSSVNRGAIRPTRPTASRMQFTLREKDSSSVKGTARQGKGSSQSSTSSFRRHHQPPATSLRRVTTNSSLNSRRIKSYAHHNHNAVEPPNQRSASTSRSRNSNRNRSSATRGRTSHRNDDNSLTDLDSVTITATHLIPAEVTIPVINGQVTEYKNIVTGKPSLEVLSPHQYTQIVGNNGQTSLYLTREDSSINAAGVTELTRYLLHDTMTTTVTFTPTTIRGRKTSFSHILPSTIYTVENVVTTLQPQISANAPLANILLSQLLLGNINLPANQLLGVLGQPAQGSLLATGLSLEQAPAAVQPLPLTEYRTHTSTYVTTIYDGKSTILPITFQGKKILTTVFDTTAQTITATEYSIDTIIKTPTIQQQLQQQQQPQVNSLLLQQLLLQQQQQQQQHNQIPQQISNTVMPQIFLGDHLQDLDGADALADAVAAHMRDNIDDIIITELDGDRSKSSRKKSRKSEKSHKRQKAQPAAAAEPEEEEERSVITLYVSGRRPGEFSTILSTVYNDHTSSLHKRQIQQTAAMNSADDLYKAGASEQNQMIISLGNFEMAQEKGSKLDECQQQGNSCLIRNLNTHTASLESIVGDVDSWYTSSKSKSKKQAKTLTFRSQTTSQLSSKLLLNIF